MQSQRGHVWEDSGRGTKVDEGEGRKHTKQKTKRQVPRKKIRGKEQGRNGRHGIMQGERRREGRWGQKGV